jgi:hypothetical protein
MQQLHDELVYHTMTHVAIVENFRYKDCRLVRVTKPGHKVILEPIAKKPFDVAACRAGLHEEG